MKNQECLYSLVCEVSLTQQVPRDFIFIFSTIFQYTIPYDPQKTNLEGIFFSFLRVPFLGVEEKDWLVLAGVRVTNFLIHE